MATGSSNSPPYDVEDAASYVHIPAGPQAERPKIKKLFASILFSSFFLLSLFILINQKPDPQAELDGTNAKIPTTRAEAPSRGVAQGVSENVFRRVSGGNLSFAWSNVMLSWQRTAYHFQPQKNWINDLMTLAVSAKDPNGPLFFSGWYHLFYQYNPDSSVWGNITWGHAVSRDLIHWLHLPFAMVPDQWYDINGVWTGSATILPEGRIVMLYTGDTHDEVQVQCSAYPANLSDPLLLDWVKDSNNPVLFPPPDIGSKDFRDPTTAWLGPDGGKWRITIGSKVNNTGISLIYETKDFIAYELADEYLHQVPGTGMWGCVDFYPVSLTEENGLDTSAKGPGVDNLGYRDKRLAGRMLHKKSNRKLHVKLNRMNYKTVRKMVSRVEESSFRKTRYAPVVLSDWRVVPKDKTASSCLFAAPRTEQAPTTWMKARAELRQKDRV